MHIKSDEGWQVVKNVNNKKSETESAKANAYWLSERPIFVYSTDTHP